MTTQHDHHVSPQTVSVVGLGPMGRALARAFLLDGQVVKVWNRTPEKAADVVAAGASLAPSLADAFRTSSLVVVCVVDDDTVSEIVGTLDLPWLDASPVVLNLTADSPARTRMLATQMGSLGLTYLDGAIMTPAATIGTDAARVLVAGPQDVWESRESGLRALGEIFYLGPDIASAATYDVALLSLFWTSFAGIAQALALVQTEGIDSETFTPHAIATSQLTVDLLPTLARDAAERRFAGAETASVDSLQASISHLRAAFQDARVSTTVLDAIATIVAKAVDDGRGSSAPVVLSETLAASNASQRVPR
ncbi:NAD(P)-binding domain-containing protein [Microbacterium sp. A8/3-1]|uniref:NAD(P)-binding domain-containing protein n=1 Tax=Microbacterium sp. A8/3-1 TaxID=3160749 RepID=A0AAU7W274_9MICO